VIRLIYNLLWPLGLLLFLPGYLIKMFRRGGYRKKFGQRIGIYDADVRARLAKQTSIWLHAVSVGEVAIALKLAAQLRATTPELACVLTTTTTTGFAFANRNAPRWIEVMYSPLDFWPIMRRAFNVIRPRRIVLVEAEVWPNLAAEANARRIPLALVNARLSPRSEQRFRRFRRFVAPTFRLLDLICVQEQRDVERWRDLGVDGDRVRLAGSIKFDPLELDQASSGQPAPAVDALSGRLTLFGGSTHRGEEEMLGRTFLQLRAEFPTLSLFLAPRHVERVREVRKQLENLSLNVQLCSEMAEARSSRPDCLVLDRTGELRQWYGVATVVFVGKSLTARGGQNPVEPILAGKPVIFGPYMENFAALARELISNHGAVQVQDHRSLEDAIAKLLRDPNERVRLVENARHVLDSHRGATKRTAKLILDLH
jgi:3-deoxy-D-manno-octulosonic-acid transferase